MLMPEIKSSCKISIVLLSTVFTHGTEAMGLI